MTPKRNKPARAKQTAFKMEIDECFYVDIFQLAVRVTNKPSTSELWMNLHGRPEYPNAPLKQCANYAEIAFLPNDKPLPEPTWTPHVSNGTNNRISIWFHQWQFPIVGEILRNSPSVRCFYYKVQGKPPEAGIKDWNQCKTATATAPAAAPTGALQRESAPIYL